MDRQTLSILAGAFKRPINLSFRKGNKIKYFKIFKQAEIPKNSTEILLIFQIQSSSNQKSPE
jgi:hypothetical protein